MYETWAEVKAAAITKVSKYKEIYKERLNFEIKEIEKQGANTYWLNNVKDHKTFNSNPSNLLLPFLFGLVKEDPIENRTDELLCTIKASEVKKYAEKHGKIPSDFIKDPDMPDIDLDCLPEARDPIKEYAMQKYGANIDDGYGPVCSVGTWQTYKFKSAIMDVAKALGVSDQAEIYDLTTKLPEDVDNMKDRGVSQCKGRIINDEDKSEKECGYIHHLARCPSCGSTDTESPTIGQLLDEHDNLRSFAKKYPLVIEYAIKLVGRVKNMGMHAGAIIIADSSLYGNIPLAKNSQDGYWVTMWSEGRNTQLSKFGYSKWDILGLKTLYYIFKCCKLIEQNRGISFGENASGWEDIDPTKNIAGHYFDKDGTKKYIRLDDPEALKLANEQKTDAVFQFDTDLAKSILFNGVTSFYDLMLLNAMGHPGPMQSIPEAMKNRDSGNKIWENKLHKDILAILKSTYGVIVYQEQLQEMWLQLAGFTAPEAQEARKAVAKKWTHLLKPIKAKWVEGASKTLGKDEAESWWSKMESFGRYAFNKSHAVSYCLMTHRCLWLKAHFAPEFWAAVMSDCHPDKLVRYMSVARSEDWNPTHITNSGKSETYEKMRFSTLNINNLTVNFTVTDNEVNQGLIGIKQLGEKAAQVFEGKGEWRDIDHFVEGENRKNKVVLERFIKLGAFAKLKGHENSYALWQYYQYKYCSGLTELKNKIRTLLLEKEGWNDKTIQAEKDRQVLEFKRLYPKRKKIPLSINNWKPKPDDTRQKIIDLYDEDYSQAQKLEFQKEFLGYYLDSPMELYNIKGNCTIKDAKIKGMEGCEAHIEAMIINTEIAESKKNGSKYAKLTITDGVQRCLIFMWQNELNRTDHKLLKEMTGVKILVRYDKQRNTFSMVNNTNLLALKVKNAAAR